jgi:MFS family permease
MHAFYLLFAVSVVPAFLGVVFLFFVKETRPAGAGKEKPRPNIDVRKYGRNLRIFFLAQCFFALGNSSNQFLLLRSMDLGVALSGVILMYLVFNLSSTVLSGFFGRLSDSIGRRRVLVAGYALYAGVYGSFGLITKEHSSLLWVFWIAYGVYYAMTEGVEKAFVGDLSPKDSKATALGFFYTIVGIGLLPASVIAGFLFSLAPAAPFIFGSCMSGVAFLIVALFVKEPASGGA